MEWRNQVAVVTGGARGIGLPRSSRIGPGSEPLHII
jgi:hypothetical protein